MSKNIPQDDCTLNTPWLKTVDQREVEDLIGRTYSTSQQLNDREVAHAPREGGFDVKSVYSKKGRLLSFQKGTSFTQALWQQFETAIKDSLIESPGVKVRTHVLFSHGPTSGVWRYRDRFQILPMPEGAPKPPFLMAPHPFLLQVSFRDSTDFPVAIRRHTKAMREIELLLNVLVRFGVKAIPNSATHRWVYVERTSDDDSTTMEAELRQEGYASSDTPEDASGFLEHSAGPIPEVPTPDYYKAHGIGTGDEFSVPTWLEEMLDIYFGLTPDARASFLRCAFWLQQSQISLSSSASQIAQISAIESLYDSKPNGPPCTECDKATGPGPVKKFHDFVETYAKGVGKKDRKTLYDLRSALAHGGSLLLSDSELLAFNPQQLEEYSMGRLGATVARTCALNWLLEFGASSDS